MNMKMGQEPLDPKASYFRLLLTDWRKELRNFQFKQEQRHEAFKKELKKEGLIARDFAERMRGGVFFVFGLSAMAAAVIASTSGVLELQVIVQNLIESAWGRILLFLIGLAYFIAGVWRIMTGRGS